MDVWTRRIVGWTVEERETAEAAAALVEHICRDSAVDPRGLVLHADNGKPMRGSAMVSTLQWLGIIPSFSRPHVSDDNPYSEALFRTLKHTPAYPRMPFADVEAARRCRCSTSPSCGSWKAPLAHLYVPGSTANTGVQEKLSHVLALDATMGLASRSSPQTARYPFARLSLASIIRAHLRQRKEATMFRSRRSFWSVLFLLPASTALANGPDVLSASRHDTSPPLAQLSAGARAPASASDKEGLEPRSTGPAIASGRTDPVASELAGPLEGVTTVIRFNGQSAADNRRVLGFAFVPPDTNGAVGASQFVQMVNVTIAVYGKRDGALQLGPAPIHTLWQGFGGLCENGGSTATFSDGGDPIVLYDHLADRWLVSQLQYDETFTHTAQCIAISTTSDARGSYNRYEFDFGANFPDYPKFGISPDGYYNSINVFPGNSFAGAEACAFDRAAMLAGAQANAICFQQPSSVSSLLPADLDGSTLPPAGSPNYFVGLADASHLNLFRFHADFANPASSTFSGPTLVAVADYNEICARATTVACIPEPPPGEKVDGLADRVMFRLAYRNFGDHESLVVNHTVLGGALAGIRWYEIRNPGSAPAVFQQGTVIDPISDFWMGSIAMDMAGDIALGFSSMSRDQFSSVYVAGRKPSDPAGKMFGPLVMAGGSGVQFNSFKRWGDYSSMTVDPKDDCTFWYTQEYYITTGSFNWATRVSAFKFDRCKPSVK